MAELDWPLCVIDIDDIHSLKAAYRAIYITEYVNAKVCDWGGRRVRFHSFSFAHAFSSSENYRLAAGVHEVDLSLERAQRIYWIKQTLLGEANIEVLSQLRKDNRGNMKRRRTIVVLDNRYVVVLEPCSEPGFEYQFITAFVADRSYMERIRRGATVVERRKQHK